MMFSYIAHNTIFLLIFIYVELKNEVNTIDVNITGDYLVSGGKDAAIRLYSVKTTQVSINKYIIMTNNNNKYEIFIL